jgi:hypothetical protein
MRAQIKRRVRELYKSDFKKSTLKRRRSENTLNSKYPNPKNSRYNDNHSNGSNFDIKINNSVKSNSNNGDAID